MLNSKEYANINSSTNLYATCALLNKIASTKYELYYKSDREKSIYSSIMDRNQITYIYQVREHSLSQNGLAYKLYIHLQNLEEETQPAYNTMVVGIETETIAYGVDIDERGFDDNLYFTKKKLHIGQNMTKSKLEKNGTDNEGFAILTLKNKRYENYE